MVNYEKRQAALHLNPSTVRVIFVRNTFSGLEVLKKQAATLTGDRVIVLQDKLKKKIGAVPRLHCVSVLHVQLSQKPAENQ